MNVEVGSTALCDLPEERLFFFFLKAAGLLISYSTLFLHIENKNSDEALHFICACFDGTMARNCLFQGGLLHLFVPLWEQVSRIVCVSRAMPEVCSSCLPAQNRFAWP